MPELGWRVSQSGWGLAEVRGGHLPSGWGRTGSPLLAPTLARCSSSGVWGAALRTPKGAAACEVSGSRVLTRRETGRLCRCQLLCTSQGPPWCWLHPLLACPGVTGALAPGVRALCRGLGEGWGRQLGTQRCHGREQHQPGYMPWGVPAGPDPQGLQPGSPSGTPMCPLPWSGLPSPAPRPPPPPRPLWLLAGSGAWLRGWGLGGESAEPGPSTKPHCSERSCRDRLHFCQVIHQHVNGKGWNPLNQQPSRHGSPPSTPGSCPRRRGGRAERGHPGCPWQCMEQLGGHTPCLPGPCPGCRPRELGCGAK